MKVGRLLKNRALQYRYLVIAERTEFMSFYDVISNRWRYDAIMSRNFLKLIREYVLNSWVNQLVLFVNFITDNFDVSLNKHNSKTSLNWSLENLLIKTQKKSNKNYFQKKMFTIINSSQLQISLWFSDWLVLML